MLHVIIYGLCGDCLELNVNIRHTSIITFKTPSSLNIFNKELSKMQSFPFDFSVQIKNVSDNGFLFFFFNLPIPTMEMTFFNN